MKGILWTNETLLLISLPLAALRSAHWRKQSFPRRTAAMPAATPPKEAQRS
jgi:hypothetical protein